MLDLCLEMYDKIVGIPSWIKILLLLISVAVFTLRILISGWRTPSLPSSVSIPTRIFFLAGRLRKKPQQPFHEVEYLGLPGFLASSTTTLTVLTFLGAADYLSLWNLCWISALIGAIEKNAVDFIIWRLHLRVPVLRREKARFGFIAAVLPAIYLHSVTILVQEALPRLITFVAATTALLYILTRIHRLKTLIGRIVDIEYETDWNWNVIVGAQCAVLVDFLILMKLVLSQWLPISPPANFQALSDPRSIFALWIPAVAVKFLIAARIISESTLLRSPGLLLLAGATGSGIGALVHLYLQVFFHFEIPLLDCLHDWLFEVLH